MKATNVKVIKHHNNQAWFVTAKVNSLEYQCRFNHEPSNADITNSMKSFEINYAGLNESNNKPIKTEKHHGED